MGAPTHRTAIVGPGALGCLYAHRLAASGADVSLVAKDADQAASLRKLGVGQKSGTPMFLPVLTAEDPPPARFDRAPGLDLALVLVKSHATEAAARTIARLLAPDGLAVSLQNGLGNVEKLAAALGRGRVGGGTTAQGAYLASTGRYVHGGEGLTRMAVLEPEAEPALRALADLLSAAGLPTVVGLAVEPILWDKLVMSAALNPACALSGHTNAGLLADPLWSALARTAGREAAAVATAEGFQVPADPWVGLSRVLSATGSNKNSMLVDLRAGRPTEIEAINGEVVRRARQHGLAVPVNEAFLALVRAAAP